MNLGWKCYQKPTVTNSQKFCPFAPQSVRQVSLSSSFMEKIFLIISMRMWPSSSRLDITTDFSKIASGLGAGLFSKIPAPVSFLACRNFHYILTISDINLKDVIYSFPEFLVFPDIKSRKRNHHVICPYILLVSFFKFQWKITTWPFYKSLSCLKVPSYPKHIFSIFFHKPAHVFSLGGG